MEEDGLGRPSYSVTLQRWVESTVTRRAADVENMRSLTGVTATVENDKVIEVEL